MTAAGSDARRALVDALAAGREVFLQACWAAQHWGDRRLLTRDGQSLEVIAPGWLNRGKGPDFTEARLVVGGDEVWGDVEVHVDEADWWLHRHDRDSAYGRVVLHVVLRDGPRPARHPVTGLPLPVFAVAPFLPADVRELAADPEQMLRRYERLPGRCGLRGAQVGREAVERVVAHAAEVRAGAKAARFQPALEAGEDAGQVLYAALFHYLGYRPHAPLFDALAQRYPLAALLPLLERPPAEARAAVLARWFGSAGLLEPEPERVHADAREEYADLRERWRALGERPLRTTVTRSRSRPWNAPERRMAAMYHHLAAMGQGDLLKRWLALLQQLDRLRDDGDFRRTATRLVEAAFPTPGDEPWHRRVGYALPPRRQGARLVGPDRLVALLANAVLPFFLAWARRQGDAELEKVLYRLYIVLPPEAPSGPTRFMERRLTTLAPLRRTLRTQQGLLQIHSDFCLSFNAGCEQCDLPGLIEPLPGPPEGDQGS